MPVSGMESGEAKDRSEAGEARKAEEAEMSVINNVPECECGGDEIRIYLVFSYDLDTYALSLRAVDRTEERAAQHVEMLKTEARNLGQRTKVWYDRNMTDHAFGADMLR